MKFGKNYLLSFVFIIMLLIISLIFGFAVAELPLLIKSTIFSYKFLKSVDFFIQFFPIAIALGCAIGWAIDFGLNQEGSRLRFSPAMFGRYQKVLISSLVFVFLISILMEIFLPFIKADLKRKEELPEMMQDYNLMANKLYEQKDYVNAYHYAKLAYEIDSENEDNKTIMYKTEISLRDKQELSKDLQDITNKLTFKDSSPFLKTEAKSVTTEPYDVKVLLEQARKSLNRGDLFDAHFQAQMALKGANPKDINILELKQIAASAWNDLSSAREKMSTEEERIFAKKYEGYISLINEDNLRAYYIFKTLSLYSKALSIDPDISRYLTIAEARIKNQYFFIDETFNMQAFETATNVYFKLKRPDGMSEVFFIKGITPFQDKTGIVQYLRGLSVFTIDENGEYRGELYAPYARISGISTDAFAEGLKNVIGFSKELKVIPYIMLKSVDRNLEGVVNEPVCIGFVSDMQKDGYMLLPMEYDDFELIKAAASGLDAMPLNYLYKFSSKAEKYGYSCEIFTQTILNRLLYPLFILIMFILVAYFSWNGRLPENSSFKFKWIIVIPLFAATYYFLYILSMGMFKLLNYSLFAIFGIKFALAAGIAIYVLLLFIASVGFLACRNSQRK